MSKVILTQIDWFLSILIWQHMEQEHLILIIIQATGCLTGVSFLKKSFFTDNLNMKIFPDTKMEFLKIYHDEIERQHMMSANMTLRDGHLEGEDGHDDHEHDDHGHDHDDHDDDFYDLDTIARDVMAHDPYVLLEQMMFRWVRFCSDNPRLGC